MIKANLLPLKAKLEIETLKRRKTIWFYGILACALSFGFLIILYGMNQYIQDQLKATENVISVEEGSAVAKESKWIESSMAEMNKHLSVIEDILKKPVIQLTVLDELAKIKPAGVFYRNMKISIISKKVSIAGYAKTRSDVLVIKESLQASSIFSSVESPFSNLLQTSDVEFSFNLVIK